jgi:hypothetical protein
VAELTSAAVTQHEDIFRVQKVRFPVIYNPVKHRTRGFQ